MEAKKLFEFNNGGSQLKLIDMGNMEYKLVMDDQSIKLDINDIYALKNRGVNQVTSLANGRFDATIVHNYIPENSIFNSGNNKDNDTYIFKIKPTTDMGIHKDFDIKLSKTQFGRMMEILNQVDVDRDSPFKPGDKVWVGSIGVFKDGEWSYFTEPYEATIGSITKNPVNDLYQISIKKEANSDPFSNNIHLLFKDGDQIGNNIYICDKDRDAVIEKMYEKMKKFDPDIESKDEFKLLFDTIKKEEVDFNIGF